LQLSETSLAEYEVNREKIKIDKDCIVAFRHAKETRCIISFERRVMKPVFE